jgi:hypothetical protein
LVAFFQESAVGIVGSGRVDFGGAAWQNLHSFDGGSGRAGLADLAKLSIHVMVAFLSLFQQSVEQLLTAHRASVILLSSHSNNKNLTYHTTLFTFAWLLTPLLCGYCSLR